MASETATHESSAGMPQLDFTTFPNQVFWFSIGIVIVYILMSRIALPRIATVLAERQNVIQRDLDQAEDMRKKTQEAEESYNKALLNARAQAGEIVAKAKAEMQAQLDEAIAKADAKIAAKAVESEVAIKAIRDNAMSAVQEVAQSTTKDVIDAIAPSVANEAAIKSAVSNRMKG